MKALNRKEALVNAKANGTLDSFKPLTRDEAFTKKALGLGGGGSGGMSSFVVNFNFTETGTPFVDCTYADIIEAQDMGKEVVVKMGVSVLPYGSTLNDTIAEKTWLLFSIAYTVPDAAGGKNYLNTSTVAISNDNEVKYYAHKTEITLDYSM